MECPRTQKEYDNSYSKKIFCFYFFNYYSTPIYIAFIKPIIYTYPNDQHARMVMGSKTYQLGGCYGGCNYELAIQLIITMVGKQFKNNIREIVYPKLKQIYKVRHTVLLKCITHRITI